MLTLEIELLTGVYRASLPDGSEAEWPPHPERLFSALVQAWADGGRPEQERAALEWLECLAPPSIEAAIHVARRDSPTVYVPPNDPKGSDLAALPSHRKRQARTFLAAVPESPLVRFHWDTEPPAEHAKAIGALAGRVVCLGHSASLVRCSLVASKPPELPLWSPSESGEVALRMVYPGRLEDLEHWYSTAGGKNAERPRTRRVVQYGIVSGPPRNLARSHFGGRGDWVVFEDVGGWRPDLLAFGHVARRLRDALMSVGPQPAPESLSGHAEDGSPTGRPHVAFVPLANVGHSHSTGDLLGVAVVLPRDLPREERRPILQSLARFAGVDAGGEPIARLRLTAEREWLLARTANPSRASLRPGRWCGASRVWASVTPVFLDRFPRKDDPEEEAGIVAAACRNIGLPEPVEIQLHKHSAVSGAPSAYFSGRGDWSLPRDSHFRARPRRHVVLRFDEPVEGPVILGAGRFHGFGLCLPLGGMV